MIRSRKRGTQSTTGSLLFNSLQYYDQLITRLPSLQYYDKKEDDDKVEEERNSPTTEVSTVNHTRYLISSSTFLS